MRNCGHMLTTTNVHIFLPLEVLNTYYSVPFFNWDNLYEGSGVIHTFFMYLQCSDKLHLSTVYLTIYINKKLPISLGNTTTKSLGRRLDAVGI